MSSLHADDLEDGEIEGETAADVQPRVSAREKHDLRQSRDHQTTHQKHNDQSPSKKKKKQKSQAAAQHLPTSKLAPEENNDGSKGKKYLDIYGSNAHAEVEIKTDGPVRLNDVQGLVLWALADHLNPRWVFLKNKPLLERVVLVLVHGISKHLYNQKQELLPSFQQLGKPVVVVAQNSTVKPSQTMAGLLNTSIARKRKRDAGGPSSSGPKGISSHGPPFPPSHYILSLREMEANNYPLPLVNEDTGLVTCPPGYVATRRAASGTATEDGEGAPEPKRYRTDHHQHCSPSAPPPPPGDTPADHSSSPANNNHNQNANGPCDRPCDAPCDDPCDDPCERMVAMDCEMCVTAEGFALTRISLVDREGRVLMDELVVPDSPITDYNTRYSGITEQMLKGVKTRLKDVQERFLSLVSAETLLVGHSLDNDLQALRVLHARVLDTALLFPHPKGPPFKSALKVLALRFLKRRIQDGSHDSIIDARTAMDLANLKIKHGPTYGTSEYEGSATKLVDVLGDHGRKCCLVDRRESLMRFATGSAAAVPVFSDADAVQALGKQVASGAGYHFLCTQLIDLSMFLYHRSLSKHADAGGEGGAPSSSQKARQQQYTDQDLDNHLRRLDDSLAKIYAALPANTLLMVATGQGDTAEVRRQQEQKFKRQRQIEGMPPWTLADEDAYADLANREILGLCFCKVKH